jgi:hypothetical protein
MITPRASHTATVISSGPNAGKILIAGGEQNNRVMLSSTELYDPTTNSFIAGPPLYSPRTGHVAIMIATGPNAGKIMIAGGNFANLDSTELYNPATNRFEPGPAMHGAHGMAGPVQLPPAPPR